MIKKDFLEKVYTNKFFPLGFSAILFLLYFIIKPNWIYNNIGWVDGWAYTGFFFDLKQLREFYPTHPAGDLLPLTLIGHFFYSVFQPFWANFIFKFCRFVLLGYMIFKTIEIETDRKTALLTTTFMFATLQTLVAIQSDYTDGMVIFYLTATIFSIVKAYEIEIKKIWIFLSGLFFSMSVFTAILSVVNIVPLFLLIAFKTWQKNKKLKSIILSALLFIFGFMTAAGMLSLISYLMFGTVYFFESTIVKMFSFLGETRGVQNLKQIIEDGGALIFFLTPFILTIPVALSIKENKEKYAPNLIYFIMFLASLSIYSYLQFIRHQETISNIFYINHIVPFFITAVGICFFYPWIKALSGKNYIIILITSLLTGISVLFKFNSYLIIILLGLYLLIKSFKEKREILSIVFIFIFFAIFANFNSNPKWGGWLVNKYRQGDVRIRLKNYINADATWIDYIKIVDPKREKYLWYNANKNWHMRGLSSSSHLWQGRLLNEEMPDINGKVIGGMAVPIEKINNLILLGQSEIEVKEGINAINNKFNCQAVKLIYGKEPIYLYVTECRRR